MPQQERKQLAGWSDSWFMGLRWHRSIPLHTIFCQELLDSGTLFLWTLCLLPL